MPLRIIDESAEHAAMIGFAAGIDPARAIYGAVGVFRTHCLVGWVVLARITGAEGLPVVASGIRDVAIHFRFDRELVLSAVREAAHCTVTAERLSVVTHNDEAKIFGIGTVRGEVRSLEPERCGAIVVFSNIISVDRHRIVGGRDRGVSEPEDVLRGAWVFGSAADLLDIDERLAPLTALISKLSKK